jgi:probable rRNA maturation factor
MVQFFSDEVKFPTGIGEITEPVIQQICQDHRMAVDYMNVVFVSDEKLLEINRDFLQHDYYTDIITFNYADDPKTNIEGELYISVDRVAENAGQQGASFMNELARVVFHGVLHLCGMKDNTDTDKKAMQLAENKYVNKIVSRGT